MWGLVVRLGMTLNRVMTYRHRGNVKTLASLSRINLLHELQQHGTKTVIELAEATGLHHNTAREHLHRLIEAGFVSSESVPRTTKGRPKILYRAATGQDDPTRQARLRAAERRTQQFRKLLPICEVADRSQRDRQIDMLDDHMDQCGFDAVVEMDPMLMTMHGCPFSELAKNNPQVCQVHFALVKDALQLTDGPLEARELHSFPGAHDCTVDLDCSGKPAA